MSPVIQFKAGNKESQPEHNKMPKYGNIKTKEGKGVQNENETNYSPFD